jgi:hypothetical protein
MRKIGPTTSGTGAFVQVSGHIRGSPAACRGIGHNGPVATPGKRAAARRKANFRPASLLLTVGVTAGVIAWGYLVKAAIDFGIQARSGTSGAWLYLGLASFGAVACLFVGLMMISRLLREVGITQPARSPDEPVPPPRVPGGRRAAR